MRVTAFWWAAPSTLVDEQRPVRSSAAQFRPQCDANRPARAYGPSSPVVFPSPLRSGLSVLALRPPYPRADQSKDREGTRSHRSAVAAVARRRGDSVTSRQMAAFSSATGCNGSQPVMTSRPRSAIRPLSQHTRLRMVARHSHSMARLATFRFLARLSVRESARALAVGPIARETMERLEEGT